MTADRLLDITGVHPRPSGVREWRARLDRIRVPPVIAVAGSRGKTSVLRAVESILRAGGHRFASWTDRGVEIEGERQRGELGPWSRALTRLTAGGLDVALRELDWATLQAISAPATSYPLIAISNVCGNNEECLISPETLLARRALSRVRSHVGPPVRLILNADDFAVCGKSGSDLGDAYLVGISADAPVLNRHIHRSGDACWVEESTIVIREDGRMDSVVALQRLGWTGGGAIPFAVQNALLATAIARECGLTIEQIAVGLAAHEARAESMPGSFNVFAVGASTVIVDRPMPSWFLRAPLRAASGLGSGRLLRVVAPMAKIPLDDLFEVGRLLGRNGGVLIVHGDWGEERLGALRQGAAANRVPPIFLQAATERSAILQGLAMLRADDVMLVLAENAPAAVRLLSRQARLSEVKRPTTDVA